MPLSCLNSAPMRTMTGRCLLHTWEAAFLIQVLDFGLVMLSSMTKMMGNDQVFHKTRIRFMLSLSEDWLGVSFCMNIPQLWKRLLLSSSIFGHHAIGHNNHRRDVCAHIEASRFLRLEQSVHRPSYSFDLLFDPGMPTGTMRREDQYTSLLCGSLRITDDTPFSVFEALLRCGTSFFTPSLPSRVIETSLYSMRTSYASACPYSAA